MTLIKSLLDQWEEGTGGEETRADQALHILAEAETFIGKHKPDCFQREFWHRFLNVTRKPAFLKALPSDADRNSWAELVFRIIRLTNYTLKEMLVQRVEEHPKKILFKDMTTPVPVEWTYEQILRHIREIAAVFIKEGGENPRVAIFSDNCLEGACSDLACLSYGIFVTPLNTHFSVEILVSIFDTLKITVAVADSKERILRLQEVRQKTVIPFRIYSLLHAPALPEVSYLPEECKKVLNKEIESFLEKNPSRANNQVATTMFTSGSTGIPKGVSFSLYQIVTKRFARAAALPTVGEETFLCYLPLFHTFGRYLEMTGAIFWSGTYVFAGNTSAETLLSLFPKVNPTGFISIPLRWQELYEKCLEETTNIESTEIRNERVREIVGHQLRWGLSAAGYLDPNVFRFFNSYGIHLNSGFGMTEATGGITMTPPGRYRDSSVGIPLPGVYTRLTEASELEISGHYIAAYLEEAGPEDVIPYPVSAESDRWLSTGDVFRIGNDGYYEIIDRIKDIYKNNRGQTVAPQVIEKKFHQVPGIKNTFVVGDNRPYNVLLIVPDLEDPLFHSITGDNVREYFHQIVMSANLDVAPYERVINFSLLLRDFSAEKGELTPKGSYNRKVIEKNFAKLIDTLYKSNIITIQTEDLVVTIPRWFFRDLGILENDILFENDQLVNRRSNHVLTIKKKENNLVLVGDLVYRINAASFDLGVFARQPRLWIANPELIAFCPIKESWDIPLGPVVPSVYISSFRAAKYTESDLLLMKIGKDENLSGSNLLISKAFFLPFEEAYSSL
ncbi:MAG TPA: AMP-binding protein, partial [Bacteroidales bacterium]|nr:AMP-binding protein [Bacteroidales bacterium]